MNAGNQGRADALHVGLIVSDMGQGHGWSQYSASVLRALHQRDDVRVTAITTRTSPDFEDIPLLKILPDTVPPRRLTLARMGLAYGRVRHALRDCDVIHNLVEIYAPVGAWVAGERPYFMTCHGTYVHLPLMRRAPVRQLYQRAFERAHLVAVSHYTAGIARQLYPGNDVTVVLNGVHQERMANLPDMPRQPHSLLTVGGVKARKGTLELVEAVAMVRERLPDVQCYIVGNLPDTSYVGRVRERIERLGLGDNVHLMGFVDEERLRALYARATVFVMPSMNHGYHFEGFGLVHLEASSVGLPVIGTSGCGIEDAIDDGQTGLLVPQAHIENALPEAILRILQDEDLALRMGQAGRRKAQSLTWDSVAQALIRLYQA